MRTSSCLSRSAQRFAACQRPNRDGGSTCGGSFIWPGQRRRYTFYSAMPWIGCERLEYGLSRSVKRGTCELSHLSRVHMLKGLSLKNHFTSLISTVTFTLYALLPTLQPQVSAEYPVEATSSALQGLSAPPSSAAESTDPTPDSSMVLQPPEPNTGTMQTSHSTPEISGPGQHGGVEQSWSSEFRTESVAESEQPSLVGDSMLHGRDDDAVSSDFQVYAGSSQKGFIDNVAKHITTSHRCVFFLPFAAFGSFGIATVSTTGRSSRQQRVSGCTDK